MEEIKVGTYIRTKEGYIFQIVGQSKRVDHTLYDTDNFGICSSTVLEEITKKQSKNILDLIEEGDYVNGCKVLGIYVPKDAWEPVEINVDSRTIKYFIKDEIKSIVTKEQFEQMKYIVGDERNE